MVTNNTHHHHHHREVHHPAAPTTTAAFTIVPLTAALLSLLVPVEAASYPESYCEGVEGYAKRVLSTPACPSFVCLQRTTTSGGGTPHATVAELAAAGAVDQLRAIGYAVTCRMPRRTASLLLRDDVNVEAAPRTTAHEENSKKKTGRTAEVASGTEGSDDDSSSCDGEAVVPDNHANTAHDSLQPRHAHVKADTFYVHDVAVHPDYRGLGVAGALWKQIEAARVELRLKRMSLVAVFGASAYWARFGFREVARKELPVETVRVLEDYGEHAVFMERED